MTNVNDLLRRTLAEGEAWKQAAKERSESYIEDNDTAFKEAHEYLDSLEPFPAGGRGVQFDSTLSRDSQRTVREGHERLTRLEGVVRKLIDLLQHDADSLAVENRGKFQVLEILLRDLKEAE